MKNIKYAVLGAGNGGQSIAAYLTLRGYEVSLYDRYEDVIKPIKEKRGITLKGVSLNGFAEISNITTNIDDAINGANVIFVVVPAFAHKYIAENLAQVLKDDQVVILCPGSTGGVLEFKNILKNKKCSANIKLAETSSLFYACRIESPGVAFISGVKNIMPLASIPSSDANEIIELLKDPYPQLVKEDNILNTSLNNINAIIHPLPVLLNTGWIEATKGDFKFYYDGITPTIGKMIEKMDEERINLCEKLGVKAIPLGKSLKAYYDIDGKNIYEQVRSNKAYANIKAPDSLESRFLIEDIPMGLVPMSEIAKLVDVEMPTINMVIDLASSILERDFRKEGRNLERLGISNMDMKSLMDYIA